MKNQILKVLLENLEISYCSKTFYLYSFSFYDIVYNKILLKDTTLESWRAKGWQGAQKLSVQ